MQKKLEKSREFFRVTILLAGALFLTVPFFTFGQENSSQPAGNNSGGWQISQPANNQVNCFDYYKFQSVSVSAGPEQNVYQPGTTIKFSGTILNDNEYPVVDGNLFVRISRRNDNYMQEGQNIKDEFIAASGIAINAKSSKKVNFEWKVPVEQEKGDYVADYFFSVGKKFNLGGLPFSNEILAGTAGFEVSSTVENSISFDRSATTFNGESYRQIGNWPVISAGADADIKNILKNNFGQSQNVKITQELYRWDSLNNSDKLNSKTFFVTVPADSSREIDYDISKADGAVYYLKTTASYQGTQSIINVRFSTDAARARLNYPAITKFPVSKGEQFTLFSCFHNSTGVDTKGKVHVTLSDKDGNTVGEINYDGDIPSAMSAVKKDITADKNYNYLALKADIVDENGNIVDSYATSYDCQKLGNCLETVSSAVGKNQKSKNIFREIGAYALLILVVLGIVFILIKAVKTGLGKKMGIFFFGLVLGAGIFGGHKVLAVGNQSTSSSSGYNLYEVRDPYFGNVPISSGNVSLNHSMWMTSGNTSITCGGAVSFGYDSNLTFNANGGSWDTPYGGTSTGFGNIANVGQWIGGGRVGGYIYFTYNRPGNPSLSSSNTSIMTCSGMTCTAVPGASGNVTITAHLSGTTTRIWSLVSYYKPRCDEHRSTLSCSGSILGHPRCSDSNSTYWASPTEDNFSCGGGNTQASYPSFRNLSLGGRSLSWNINVGSCNVDGVCNPTSTRNDYAPTATGPSTPLCSSGTANPATVSFPVGQYGTDSTVNWVCQGSGTGTSENCSAQRVAPNYPPSIPTVAGPTTGHVNTPYNFTASGGNDPEGDKVYYKFDWNNDGTPDQSTTQVSSGASAVLPYQWPAAGTKTIRVAACDEHNNCSDWSSPISIDISYCTAILDPAWGECSAACGDNGEQTRLITPQDCLSYSETQDCNRVDCPQWREVTP